MAVTPRKERRGCLTVHLNCNRNPRERQLHKANILNKNACANGRVAKQQIPNTNPERSLTTQHSTAQHSTVHRFQSKSQSQKQNPKPKAKAKNKKKSKVKSQKPNGKCQSQSQPNPGRSQLTGNSLSAFALLFPFFFFCCFFQDLDFALAAALAFSFCSSTMSAAWVTKSSMKCAPTEPNA